MEQSFSTKSRLIIGLSLAGLMFGINCGGSMASGAYALAYVIPFGGGWMLPFVGIIFASLLVFDVLSINFIRAYKTTNYKEYTLALYGLHKPDANPVLKTIVLTFFDVIALLLCCVTVAVTIALFGELLHTMFGIPSVVGGFAAVVLYAVLSRYGADFLRNFNSAITIGLIICLAIILISAVVLRGDVLVSRMGNFGEGMDWSGKTLDAQWGILLAYGGIFANQGLTLTNYCGQVRDQKDAILSGVLVAIVTAALFAITGFIVLPFMPEMMTESAPILAICVRYLSPVMALFYQIIIAFACCSTAPPFAYTMSNRWVGVWKTEKFAQKDKIFIISLLFLCISYGLSVLGIMPLVMVGFGLVGACSLPSFGIPLVISIFRIAKKDKAEKLAAQSK